MNIFISYRRRDAGAFAHLLRDRLVATFGEGSVFLDVADLQPGMQWLQEIRDRGGAAGFMLVVIGPEWERELRERAHSAAVGDTTDMVKQEIELALARGSGVTVIPVLTGEATMPEPENLPRSLRPLAHLQAASVQLAQLSDDVERLVRRIQSVAHAEEATPAPPPTPPVPQPTIPPPQTPSPDDGHYDEVLKFMLTPRSVVPILGPRLGAGGRSSDSPGEPSIAERAAVATFALHLAPNELARVAQQMLATAGSPDLHDAIRRSLAEDSGPSAVHHFLASFPRRLEEAGQPRRYQMIVTTNYDRALEAAFDAEDEPYDLAVYMANGNDQGRFVHFPFDRDPEPIMVPNSYGELPIEDNGELRRTLIVKVSGAVDGSSGGYHWRENYLVTEDQYIEYLSRNSVETLVPIQILDKLSSSHVLFLGYPLVSWNLRVLLRRVWQSGRLESRSWAIEESPDQFEPDYWRQFGVDLLAREMESYIDGLTRRLQSRLAVAA